MNKKAFSATASIFLLLILLIALAPFGYAVVWSPDMKLTWNVKNDFNPSIMQASDGRIWVFWHSYRTGDAEIFYKIYDATQVHCWSSERRLTTDPDTDATPRTMQATDGKIWVVWMSNRIGVANYEIFYKIYDGSSWSMDKRLTFDPYWDELPSITQLRNGTIMVFWDSKRTGYGDIYYKTTSDNGVNWSPDTLFTFSSSSEEDWGASVMQAADGSIWLTWVRSDDIYYSEYSGSSWTPITKLSTGGLENGHPSIMQANDNRIWVAWDKGRIDPPEPEDIYYRIYDGSIWSSEEPLVQHPDNDKTPSIMQSRDGVIWMSWSSNRGDSNYDLYYRTTSIPPLHDVEIFSVIPDKILISPNENVSVEVVARNHGISNDTLDVQCYANSTLIGAITIENSIAGQLYPVTFTRNLSSGKYLIRAIVASVWEETNTDDNTFIFGYVRVSVLGDINGDKAVNKSDLLLFSEAYCSTVGCPRWDYNADINLDNITDIFDFYLLGKSYKLNPVTYSVTIDAYCNNEGVPVSVSIVMDGNPTGFTTPYTFTGLDGNHTFTVPDFDLFNHPFLGWDTGETTPTITVSQGGTYTALYGEY